MFANKIDRGVAHYERVLDGISEKLTPAIVAMGSVGDLGAREAEFMPFEASDSFAATLASALAEHDEALLAAYVGDEASVRYSRLREELAAQT